MGRAPKFLPKMKTLVNFGHKATSLKDKAISQHKEEHTDYNETEAKIRSSRN